MKNKQKIYTLNQFADLIGVTPLTVRSYHKSGKLMPAFITKGGHRRYTHDQAMRFINKNTKNNNKINVGYVRVSSKKQTDDLERQFNLMENYLITKGAPYRIIKSIGSGINYTNPSLKELIDLVTTNQVDTVFVMYKDRLVRFGFELLEQMFSQFDTNIEVINQNFNSPEEELVTDLIQIVTVFSAKLNGKRKYKINKIKKELEDD